MMDDIIRWLDTLDPGTEILTPDDWAFGKRADGTWEFVFTPCMTVTADRIAAHGLPEIIAPEIWDLRGECTVVDGVIACTDPRKRIESRAGDDPHGFDHGDTADPNVNVPAFRDPPVCSGLEYGVEWAVYGGPDTGWSGYARIPHPGHPWRGYGPARIADETAIDDIVYGPDDNGWIGFLMPADPITDPETEAVLRALCKAMGDAGGGRRTGMHDAARQARELARLIHRAGTPRFQRRRRGPRA